MKICIVNDSFSMGGAQRVVIELANNLIEAGYKISLIDFSGNQDFFYKIDPLINIPKAVRKRTLKRKIIGKLLVLKSRFTNRSVNLNSIYKEQFFELLEYFKKEVFDIVILNQGVLTGFIPLIKKEIPQMKIVAWQHNEYEIYTNQYYKAFINNYLSGLKLADLVICLTEKDKEEFKNINNNSKCIYNPLTINNNRVSKLKNPNIIFVGRIAYNQKGIDYLVEIAKKLNNGWRILIAGDGPDRSKLISIIKTQGLERKLVLKGSLSTEELMDFYLSGSILISTSRWEGFGLVLTEGMSFGLPIISFDNNGPREILKNGEYGILVERNNIENFYKSLELLMNNYELRKSYQRKSLVRVNSFRKEVILES